MLKYMATDRRKPTVFETESCCRWLKPANLLFQPSHNQTFGHLEDFVKSTEPSSWPTESQSPPPFTT